MSYHKGERTKTQIENWKNATLLQTVFSQNVIRVYFMLKDYVKPI